MPHKIFNNVNNIFRQAAWKVKLKRSNWLSLRVGNTITYGPLSGISGGMDSYFGKAQQFLRVISFWMRAQLVRSDWCIGLSSDISTFLQLWFLLFKSLLPPRDVTLMEDKCKEKRHPAKICKRITTFMSQCGKKYALPFYRQSLKTLLIWISLSLLDCAFEIYGPSGFFICYSET